MHTALLLAAITLSPAAAVKVLAIAGSVYGVLQLVKKQFPQINGYWAVALNIGLSALGTAVTVPSDQLFTVNTMLALVTASIGAAGIHGTVKNALGN
jgi:hypothetical protein